MGDTPFNKTTSELFLKAQYTSQQSMSLSINISLLINFQLLSPDSGVLATDAMLFCARSSPC